jgi:hypothetical protein
MPARTNLAFTISPHSRSPARQDNKGRPSDEPDLSIPRYTLTGSPRADLPTGNIAGATDETTSRLTSIPGFPGELERLRAAKRDAQLAANLARAQQLAEEARQLIVGDYAEAASAIAETLARLAKIDAEVGALNARFPAGIADVRIEAFRGYSATLGATVVLPGITADDAAFWPKRPRRPNGKRDLREELIAQMAASKQSPISSASLSLPLVAEPFCRTHARLWVADGKVRTDRAEPAGPRYQGWSPSSTIVGESRGGGVPGRHRKRRLMRRTFSEARSILARRASVASCSSAGEGTRSWATGAARSRLVSAHSRLSSSSSPAAEKAAAAMRADAGLVH